MIARSMRCGFLVVGLCCTGCGNGGGPSASADAPKENAMKMTVKSKAWKPGARIPNRFTGDGEDVSPPIEWSGVPESARELVLICDDPDAPTPKPWVHWVLYKIPADTNSLAAGIGADKTLAEPRGGVQGKNSWGAVGYRGPAPPKGHGVHHYHFKLYAIDSVLDVGPGLDKDALLAKMKGRVIADAELIGTYER